MNFKQFEELCKAEGLLAKKCAEFHWQIKGSGFLVNFYPDKGTVYLCGVKKGKRGYSPKEAVQIAKEAVGIDIRFGEHGFIKKAKRGDNKHRRFQLFQKDNHCHICGKEMTLLEATLDHKHPIHLGGQDIPSNWALAHKDCNTAKGHNIEGKLLQKFLDGNV